MSAETDLVFDTPLMVEAVVRPPTASELLTDVERVVRAEGDPLDAIAPPYRLAGADAATVYGTGPSIWLALSTSTETHQIITTFPLAAMGGIAIGFSVNQVRRKSAERNFLKSAALQADIRTELDEPVDIFRSGSKKTGYETVLRWYGGDEPAWPEPDETHKLSMCTRLGKLLDVVDKTPIDKVAIGTSWMFSDEEARSASDYGSVGEGRKFVERLGKGENVTITDNQVPAEVLLTTPERARALLREARKTAVADVRAFLAESIASFDAQSTVPALFTQWVEAGSDPKQAAAVKRGLRAEISRTLTNQSEPERMTGLDENGYPYRIHTSPYITVRGTNVDEQHGYKDLDGHTHNKVLGAPQTLLQRMGFNTVDDLVEKVADTTKPEVAALRAKTGLLLLLDEKSEPVEHRLKTTREVEVEEVRPNTMLERLEAEKNWRVLVKPGSNTPLAGEIRISYLKPSTDRRFYRGLARAGALLAVGGAIVAGGHANSNVRHTENMQPGQFRDAYGVDATANPELYQRFLEQQSWYDRTTRAIVIPAREKELQLEQAIMQAEDNLGLDFLMPSDKKGDTSGSSSNSSESGSPFNSSPAAGGVGDAHLPPEVYDPTGAGADYRITPYNGATANGLWGSRVDDTLTLSGNSSYPFTDASIRFEDYDYGNEHFQLPWTPTYENEVMFKVSTTYVPGQSDIAMPVQNGTYVMAAELSHIDMQGTLVRESPDILFEGKTGVYTGRRESTVSDTQQQAQTLTYWLGASYNKIMAAGDLHTPEGVDMSAVEAATKQSLGLSPDATDTAVLSAVKFDKKYSTTPFFDTDTQPIDTGFNADQGTDNTDAMTVIGETTGKNPLAVCNTAAALMLLATDGHMNGESTNYVTGYRNNGDNFLYAREAHAWVVDTNGHSFDATPVTPSDIPKRQESELFNKEEMGLYAAGGIGALMVGGAGVSMYRRRNRVREMIQEHQMTRVIISRHTPRAITALQHAAFAPDTDTPTKFKVGTMAENWVEKMESRFVVDRMTALPEIDYDEARQLLNDKGVRVPGRVRRAMKRMLKHRPAILGRPAAAEALVLSAAE